MTGKGPQKIPDMKTGISVLAAILVATVFIYWPGLRGVFLLDDLPNLNVLNQVPGNASLLDLFILAGEGFAGILGRSLSILSFLIQVNAWPEPFYFKLGNLLLHLCNGVLVFQVTSKIIRYAQLEFTVPFAPLLIAALWLLHPLQISTVLYVVQRMTMLSTFFILLGIYGYLVGRGRLQHSGSMAAMLLMLGAPFAAALFAVFSKENGVLIFPYLAALELTLFANQTPTRQIKRCRMLAVYLPIALGLTAFLFVSPSLIEGYEQKPFTLVQRLVTQPAVLTGYLVQIAAPIPSHLGLYHDDFPVFNQPLESIVVAGGWLVTGGLLLLALVKRTQWRYFSFAVLWFLAGHSLESTILPLEMYFEHRNYLPLLGPIIIVVYGLGKLATSLMTSRPEPGRSKSALFSPPFVLLAAVTLLCSIVTLTQTRLWANPVGQAETWYRNSPDSRLAQGNLVTAFANAGQVEQAFNYHQQFTDLEDPRVTDVIRWLEFKCMLPGVALPDDELLELSASNARHDYSAIFLLNNLTAGVIQGRCETLPPEKLLSVTTNLLTNDNYAVSYPDLYQLTAMIQASQGNFAAAAALASESYQLRRDVDVALYRIAWLIQAGESAPAREELTSIAATLTATQRADSRLTERIDRLTSLLTN